MYDLEDRLVRFAANIILFAKVFPKDCGGNTLEDQVIRSSVSAALNYGEAQSAESSKDFIHKMSIVLKELKETRVALKISGHIKYGEINTLSLLQKENGELIAICATRIKNRKMQN
jgi:four helix bundle protein